MIYKKGSDSEDDLLLNPAHVLLGSHTPSSNAEIAKEFMTWVASKTGGQQVVADFRKNNQVLYSQAP